MAVCARGSVLVFNEVFAGGVQLLGKIKKNIGGRAVFQGRARMITNYFFYMVLARLIFPEHINWDISVFSPVGNTFKGPLRCSLFGGEGA